MAQRRYEVLVRRLREDEGGGYLATVPELPGCMSDGETDAEAVENVRGAIASWIEQATAIGREFPTLLRRQFMPERMP